MSLSSTFGMDCHRSVLVISVISAGLVVLLWLLPSRQAVAAQPSNTMIAAEDARVLGITTYRITELKQRADSERIVAALLNSSGQVLGTFSKTREFVTEGVGPGGRLRTTLRMERSQLVWNTDVLEMTIDQLAGSFHVTLNGQPVGSASTRGGRQKASPDLVDTFKARKDLFAIGGAITNDLDRALAALSQRHAIDRGK